MTRLTRDTAKRSIEDLFEELFRDMAVDGVVEVIRSAAADPPGGLAAMVKIEITKHQPEKKPDKKGPSNADIQRQPGPDVGGGDKRRRGKAGKGRP